jgi:uncharacterized protein
LAQPPVSLRDEFGIALSNLADAATGIGTPTIRLGVTGLSRAGKTIFITALVQALLTGARLPGFAPLAEGRLIGARLAEPPDPSIPRFQFEQHLEALTGPEPHWPESTRRISQLRVDLKFQSKKRLRGALGPTLLHLDLVDYPGEWLLDLPLLFLNFAEWSESALKLARLPSRLHIAERFLKALAQANTGAEATEPAAEALAARFTQYLRQAREDEAALSALPPGRFLLPGDLEGSPALTFAPLPPPAGPVKRDSLHAMLERRYEAYKEVVIRPFFRDHFARLDRQVVLVDTIRALNAGPAAVRDLEGALGDILACFRQGENSALGWLFNRRIDKVLFAATKADHIHSSSHDRLEGVMNRLVAGATKRARFAGAETKSVALAAVRATREGMADGHEVIVGTPMPGEQLAGVRYDGKTEVALFPGDLPSAPDRVMDETRPIALNFLKFQPPGRLERLADGSLVLPHIRLDRALDYLIGDKLR